MRYIWLIIFIMACSSTPDDTVWQAKNDQFLPPKGAVTAAAWASNAALATCSWMERCKYINMVNGIYNNEPCLQYYEHLYTETYNTTDAVAAGRIRWDAESIGECLYNMATQTCAIGRPDFVLPCSNLWANTPLGGECIHSLECADNTWCQHGDVCPGTCVAAKEEGDSCFEGGPCGDGLICDLMVSDFTCVAELHEGEECNVDVDWCADGLSCQLYAGYDFTGSCEEHRVLEYTGISAGDSCNNMPSDFDLCIGENRCISVAFAGVPDWATEKVCRQPQKLGEPCIHAKFYQNNPCADDLYCKGDESTWGVCTPRLAAGELCSTDNDGCISGTACNGTTNTCAAPNRNTVGAPCEANTDCYSGKCDTSTGKCVARFECDLAL